MVCKRLYGIDCFWREQQGLTDVTVSSDKEKEFAFTAPKKNIALDSHKKNTHNNSGRREWQKKQ